MKKRGRPPVYATPDDQPSLVALRIPQEKLRRLKLAAEEQQCTVTSLLLTALGQYQDHGEDIGEVLAQTRKELERVVRQHIALQQKAERLTKEHRKQAAADKKERERLQKRVEEVEGLMRMMHEQVTVFTAAHPDLAEANARRYAEVQHEYQRRRMADIQEGFAERIAELYGQAGTKQVPMRDLIRLCHPDRWSQGQPATALAHELMVLLNK